MTLGVGMLGAGTVGSAVLRLLHEHADNLDRRIGRPIEVVQVAVRDPARERVLSLGPDRFTDDPLLVVRSEEVRVVVEVMGGIEPARTAILEALRMGKRVVTANKELLATHGPELFEAASAAGAGLHFEAAVGGGIPLIRPLIESLPGQRLTRLLGIVNGTTNFVLTRMTEDATSFDDALAEASQLEYAEPDPSDDLDGVDAAAKCAILASLAFDTRVTLEDVYTEGIAKVTPEDVGFARRLGYVVKLLAVAELEDGEVAARVHPAMVPDDHPLAAVREAFNAVFVSGPNVGELMFYGRGAGGAPTAVAVIGDLVTAARLAGDDRPGVTFPWEARRGIRPMERMESQYYLLLDVVDRPGVLAKVAGAFGRHRVSIRSVWQEGRGDEALLVLITHRANEGDLRRTVADLRALDVVLEVRSVMRVEGEE